MTAGVSLFWGHYGKGKFVLGPAYTDERRVSKQVF